MKKLITAVILAAAVTFGVLAWGGGSEPIEKAGCVSHPPPSNLTATPGTFNDGDPYIQLVWTPGDNSGVGIDIEHSTDGVNFEHLNYGYAKGHYKDNYEIVSGQTYYERVRVSPRTRGVCASAYSNVATVTIP